MRTILMRPASFRQWKLITPVLSRSIQSQATKTTTTTPTTSAVDAISSEQQPKPEPLECSEIQVPTPWGHIAAKWWGRRDRRPLLAVHGWQDNAGTFDKLIPLLPRHVGYLAIDLPGHGRSTHFAPGMCYSNLDFLHTMDAIRRHFQWPQLSLLAHSMGSQLSFVYAAAKPDLVDLLIGIDVLKPLQRSHNRVIRDLGSQLDQFAIDERRAAQQSAPPTYSYAELVERMVAGTRGSVDAASAPHLLDRSIAESPTEPGKYYFSRDSRLKVTNYQVSYHALALEMARRIQVPHLFVKAGDAPFYEAEELYHETIEVLRASNPRFRLVNVEARHHVHLTHPERIAEAVGRFVRETRPEEDEEKKQA